MKYKLKKTLNLNLTLNSSEMIMFTKGGQHSLNASFLLGKYDEEDNQYVENLKEFDECIITFQLERNEQGRFDFISSEAAKHRAQLDEINEREKK